MAQAVEWRAARQTRRVMDALNRSSPLRPEELPACWDWCRLPLAAVPQPAAALAALIDAGAALLESRTAHPGARYSYLAFSPLLELRVYPGRLLIRSAEGGERAHVVAAEAPLAHLFDWLEAVRAMPGSPGTPFAGGWIGWLGHEAGAFLLATPPSPRVVPARPQGPWAVFRLFRDVLVVDHERARAELVGGDWGEGLAAVRARLAAAAGRLRAPPPAAMPATVRAAAQATLDPEAFAREQLRLQELIRAGDCFQVNLTSSWAYPWREGERPPLAALVALYARYAAANPGAWGGFFPDEEISILCASPELLVDWRGRTLKMRPIAGTRPRGADASEDAALAGELRTDAKEQAEHAMLVDLARNDLARVSLAGSVRVPNLGGVERYRHVMHLVSEVEGEARPGLAVGELLGAVFPGGTVTGAPKRRAVTRIAECERGPRGPYTGALGYVGVGGACQWNLLIRTLTATPAHLVVHAGCGIVAASVVAHEAAELADKARAQVEAALGRATPARPEAGCGRVEAGPAWEPGKTGKRHPRAQVLILDFEDSFVHNLADYCRRLGAGVRVASAHDAPACWREGTVTHLILSPGPGTPADFPTWRHHLAAAVRHGTAVLGVCLGHQALAEADGAHVQRHRETVHGRWSPLVRTPVAAVDPLFRRWQGGRIGRYHSLVVDARTPRMEVLATLEDGTLMAVRYRGRRHWGLQFHPESLLTEDGLALIEAFLECGR